MDLGDLSRVGVEGPIEERKEVLLCADMTGRHARKDVHPEGRFGSKFRFDGLRLTSEVLIHQIVNFVNVLSEKDGLAVLVILRPTRAAAHLFDFEDGDRREAEVDIVSVQVADDHPTRGEIDSRRIVNDKPERTSVAFVAFDMQVVNIARIGNLSNPADRRPEGIRFELFRVVGTISLRDLTRIESHDGDEKVTAVGATQSHVILEVFSHPSRAPHGNGRHVSDAFQHPYDLFGQPGRYRAEAGPLKPPGLDASISFPETP